MRALAFRLLAHSRLLACLLACLMTIGCALPRAVSAVQDGKITIATARADVIAAAGEPELVLASKRVETFFYRRGDQAVSVSMLDGKVVAFSDADAWPAEAAKATDDASDPVASGKVRVGMSEVEVRAVLGEPDGITAKEGVESLHWLSGDEVDSVIHLEGGKVVGFWDRPVSEFTQNLPTSDRDAGTTNGRIRVGMTEADVQRHLGKPDGVAGKGGVITHRYESDPVFGDEIVYSVGYRDGKVVDLFEFNVSRDEDEKEEAEAKRLAADAAARGKKAESSIFSFLSNPLVQAALGAAAQGGASVSSQSGSSSDQRSLDLNGTHYEGSGPAFGQPCSPDRGCPSGYTCHLVTDTAGSCVQ